MVDTMGIVPCPLQGGGGLATGTVTPRGEGGTRRCGGGRVGKPAGLSQVGNLRYFLRIWPSARRRGWRVSKGRSWTASL